ncbi:L10-interacting MYB domain-containing protein [Euphorbia lathyris]|uniref:L10-interacting MYB domain-containing protein n=1 Tax=Euphorbia lathyris TaxID=212925 RepID=UPI003313863E
MSNQIPASNDRSRTYWTPTMERYFIDLMIEQMQRGNRIGHTFNKQAWTHMLAVFNAKFGSQYDKDVLKSRYTNLWRQFNDVKNLLGQSGFTWDETREMVVADDYVWNAYLKVHPDARSYRTKAVLNFNNLCFIYGYTAADGRYSRSSHDLDIDDEIQAANMGDMMGSFALSNNNDCPRTEWSAGMDQYFLELMLDQIVKGNKTDNAFNKQAWTEMLSSFNVKFGPQHGKRVLRHRYKKLSKYCCDMKVLLKQNGFSWDEQQQMIVADNDVWDSYIKAHPQARAYRMKTLPNYNNLILIFGDGTEDGVDRSSHQESNNDIEVSGKRAGEGKGSQTLASSDRTRTYWTPPMDRYLIDLLLDQVHKGNKLGQTFISQAWIEMVALFNIKFQSNHGKDVLKNRYKHLRRMYSDIKDLLEHNGFSWDETREMITAEDDVWDAYTKAHPDARSYRVKTVPSYQKLCVIFGEEKFNGRYSRLAQIEDPNSEIPVLMMGESSIDPSTIDWQPLMDRYFIDLMLEHARGGNKIDHTFNEQAWTHMVDSFNEKFGFLCDRYILENRYVNLMKECDNISSLLSHGGFVWDATRKMVIANEAIWEAYIQEQPDAIYYRNRILENYVDLCLIQRNELSNIGNSQDLQLQPENYPQEIGLDDGLLEDVHLQIEDIQVLDQHRNRPTTPSDDERSSKVQKLGNNEMQKAPSETAKTLLSNKESKNNSITIESAISALQAIPDIDDDLLFDACDLLEDDKKAKTFLALDSNLRKKWLLRKLRP